MHTSGQRVSIKSGFLQDASQESTGPQSFQTSFLLHPFEGHVLGGTHLPWLFLTKPSLQKQEETHTSGHMRAAKL